MTKIEWTEKTWNPVTGCTKISEGCKNCYAEKMAKRLQAMGSRKYANGFEITCHPDSLGDSLKWKKPSMVFVDSMSDLFHGDISFTFIERIWDTIFDCPQHTFQILTKRPDQLIKFANWLAHSKNRRFAYENVWLGVSVENQQRANERIPLLLKTPAAVRFISCEPLLGPISLPEVNEVIGKSGVDCTYSTGIDWLIAGCESGPKRRPADINWFRSLQFQCAEARIPFFLKQIDIKGKLVKMPQLDGVIWDQMPLH